jgi:hypothetical protein
MKASTLYWIVVIPAIIFPILTTRFGFGVQLLVMLSLLMIPFSVIIKYKPDQEVRFKTPKILKGLKTQLVRWMWYNLLIFPVLMAFYIPYNVFWLQYTPIQILKFIATNGFFGAIVNFVLRPWNAWIARFIERRNKK